MTDNMSYMGLDRETIIAVASTACKEHAERLTPKGLAAAREFFRAEPNVANSMRLLAQQLTAMADAIDGVAP